MKIAKKNLHIIHLINTWAKFSKQTAQVSPLLFDISVFLSAEEIGSFKKKMITFKVCYLTRLVSKDAASDKLPIDHTYFQVERFTQNGNCIIYQA